MDEKLKRAEYMLSEIDDAREKDKTKYFVEGFRHALLWMLDGFDNESIEAILRSWDFRLFVAPKTKG